MNPPEVPENKSCIQLPPDITKHPLWRPHHGDMTGWRYLEKGEVKKHGDQLIYLNDPEDAWAQVASKALISERHLRTFAYRRRITQQEETKRFYTVVCEITQPDFKPIKMPKGLKLVLAREGNALEQLDNIKEKVIAAIDGVKESK